MRVSASTRTLIVLLLACHFGCSQWKTSEFESAPQLPMPKLSSDCIGIEIASVTVLPDQKALLSEVYSELDEQVLSTEVRRLLSANDIRVGVFGSQLPEAIRLLLMEAADRMTHPTAETQWIGDEQRYVQCRAGKTIEIPIWKVARKLDLQLDNGHFFIPETLETALPVLQFNGIGAGDGAATLRLTPMVHHGPIRQKYVVEDNSFHFEAKQDIREYDELEMELSLQPGEVLLISCSARKSLASKSRSNPKQLGSAFFVDSNQDAQKLILIRLAQTQIQDIFESPRN